jgi:hypothetical protein
LGRQEVNSVELSDLSHSDFLLSKESYQAMLRYLQPEGPSTATVFTGQPAPGAV